MPNHAAISGARAWNSFQPYRDGAIVFFVVAIAALFGILTRPIGFLAAVWPANAILLAIMVRNPRLAAPLCWATAFLGYLFADLITGGEFFVTLWLTAANMVGVLVGFLLFMRLDERERRLETPLSIVIMFSICAIAAAATGVVGSGAAALIFNRDILTGFAFWFTTELVNSIVVLPVILSAPPARRLLKDFGRQTISTFDWRPLVILVAATLGGFLVGGPGTFAYPVPALLWCALTYSLFSTAVIVGLYSSVTLIVASAGLIPAYSETDDILFTVSLRLAIAFVVLGPLAVASINAARDELLRRLRHTADHDALTNVLARGAFLLRAHKLASAHDRRQGMVGVFMIDIDNFKTVNDRFGHAVGDKVLVETANAISARLRDNDLFGRLGGEEFAIVCLLGSKSDAMAIPERLRVAVEGLSFDAPCGQTFTISASIGVAVSEDIDPASLEDLFAEADHALYEAKGKGRNRVVLETGVPSRRSSTTPWHRRPANFAGEPAACGVAHALHRFRTYG